jgi:single-strand DNA-binding protein
MSINKVLISGNLTRDAELRQTQGGMAILSFGVAVNDRRKNNQTGEWEDYANFVDCTMFGSRAEKLSQYLTKGLKVAIEGKLHWSSWEDRNGGGKRSKLDVYVDNIEFMSARNGGGQGGYQQQPQQYQQQPQQYQQQPQQPQQGAGLYDADIPF